MGMVQSNSPKPKFLKNRFLPFVEKKNSLVGNNTASSSEEQEKYIISSLITVKQWDLLTEHMRNKPDCSKMFMNIIDHGKKIQRLPIHEVCRHKPPISLVKILASAYPDSLKVKDFKSGFLPIHLACRHDASEEVVRYLLNQYPESINVKNKYRYVLQYYIQLQ